MSVNRIVVMSSIGLLTLALGGCISNEPYQSVTNGPKVAVQLNTNLGKISVIVEEPNNNCEFQKIGQTIVKAQDAPATIYMPPGRAYLSVGAIIPYTTMPSEGVSFLLEEGQQYLVEFKRLGNSASWHGSKMEYEFNYLNISGEFPVPVTTDYHSICKREQAAN